MANDPLIDFLGDGSSSDTVLSYPHIQTIGYSGTLKDYVIPAAANYPPVGKDSSGNAVNPSRYIVRLNFVPFVNANLPMLVKTSGGTTLTLHAVSGLTGNQYARWSNDNANTISPDVLEFPASLAGQTICIDCYAKESILHAEQANAPLISGDVDIGGKLNIKDGIGPGHTITGNNAMTIGNTNEAVGDESLAIGLQSKALRDYQFSQASGNGDSQYAQLHYQGNLLASNSINIDFTGETYKGYFLEIQSVFKSQNAYVFGVAEGDLSYVCFHVPASGNAALMGTITNQIHKNSVNGQKITITTTVTGASLRITATNIDTYNYEYSIILKWTEAY